MTPRAPAPQSRLTEAESAFRGLGERVEGMFNGDRASVSPEEFWRRWWWLYDYVTVLSATDLRMVSG